jgi:LysR family transcriptional activator of nhaA
MNPWLNYHHLFYFKTIAEEGSVSKAAEKLRLGQPTLSAQLKQFEDAIGVRLFERQHKRLILTEQGRIALDYAKNIFKLGSEMVEVLHDKLKPLKPSVHIGALDSVPKQVILKLVSQAFRISPCQITLSEGRFDELLRELTAHHVDLVITNFLPTGTDAKGLFPRSLGKKTVSFYGAPKFKSLRRGFPKSISDQPLIIPTYDSKMRQDLEHWAKVHSLDLNVITESQDIAMQKLMALNEMGLIATAAHAVSNQVRDGSLVEIGALQGIHEELFLVTAQRKIANSIAAKLMESFTL